MVALRSKVYCMRYSKGNTKRTVKGVKKSYKESIPFSAFLKCLTSINSHKVTQYTIRSKSHNVMTQKMMKLAFSSFDDKRWLWNCRIHTSPYSSYLIKKYKKCPFC